MADTSVTYVGDNATVAYAVPFRYLETTHVVVEVDSIERDRPADWYFSGAQEITFVTAPETDAGILIRRVTPGDERLVDFQNGSVLTEADLDRAIDQVFFLAQEAKENYADLLYAEMVRIGTATGITSTDPTEWLASAVDTMLASDASSVLQAAVGDIATLGEDYLDHADLLQLIGDASVDRTTFTIDETTTLVDGGGTTMAAKFSALVSGSADVVADIALLGIANGTDTAFILDTSTIKLDSDGGNTVSTALARQAIELDVNGYVTGFEQINDGTSGDFKILADKFSVVTPSALWQASTAYAVGDMVRPTTPLSPIKVFECTTAGTSGGTEPTWDTTVANTNADGTAVWTTRAEIDVTPFTVESGLVTFNSNVVINGDLLVNGTVTSDELTGSVLADLYATTGQLTVDTGGHIKGGQTAYDTGAGFFLGYDTSAYKFSIGDGGANSLTWDGSLLTVTGEIVAGVYSASDNIILSATTERSEGATYNTYVKKKEFIMDRAGTVRVTFDAKYFLDPPGVRNIDPKFDIRVNGVSDTIHTATSASYVTKSTDVSGLVRDDTVEIWVAPGQDNLLVETTGLIENAYIKADVALSGDGEVSLD